MFFPAMIYLRVPLASLMPSFMSFHHPPRSATLIHRFHAPLAAGLVLASLALSAQAQWVAFNDHYSGPGTHANATDYNVFGTSGGTPSNTGPLKNIVTGATLPVTLTIVNNGGAGGATAGGPTAGTPAYNTFNGYIDWGSGTVNHAIQIAAGSSVTHTFTGLNPAKRYSFMGTGIRGGDTTYSNRWTTFSLEGADAFGSAHTSGGLTNGLPANQVAINTGINTAGDMAVWTNINPGADGTFSVVAAQYTGAIPGGGTANGSYGYGLGAERLEEIDTVLVPVRLTNQPQSQVVEELQPATFSVGYVGNPMPTFQWYKDLDGEDLPLPGATNATYQITAASLGDDGALFRMVASNMVSNVTYIAVSSNALLRVNADTNRPVLLGAASSYPNMVNVFYSEAVTPQTATNKANYVITNAGGSLTISNVALGANPSNVVLTTAPHGLGVLYTLTVNGIRDRSAAANLITPNSQATFTSVAFIPTNVGSPTITGAVSVVGGGFNISGGGNDIGGTADQFAFNYQQRTGDFDVQVRLAGLDNFDAWAKAGLMARESLNGGSAFAAVLATPNVGGVLMASRASTGGAATPTGAYPIAYPNTWLRLKRVGNVFSGFASFDAVNWTALGSLTLSLPSTVYLGMAVTSHDANQAATAAFRDFGTVSGGTTGVKLPPGEPLGPCNRRTGLVISEILYHPRPLPGATNSLEFIELFNAYSLAEDFTGYRISGAVDYAFPSNLVMQPGAFLVLARDPAFVRSYYGITNVVGPWDNAAANGLPGDGNGGTIRLRNQTGAILLDVQYEARAPWPIAADGAGHSLVLARPSYGEHNMAAWAASDSMDGSPGKPNPVNADPLSPIRINEFLANSPPPQEDYLELYNHSAQAVDLSGAWLSDRAGTNKFRIPDGTIIGPTGFVFFAETNLGFALDAGGERIFLVNSNQTRVMDAVEFGGQGPGIARGRYPDGAPSFYPLAAQTPGAPNANPRLADVIINEIMYSPITGNSDDEYVELYNRSTHAVNVGQWRFVDGISFNFPDSLIIPAGGYLVVAKNVTNLLASHRGVLTSGNTVGNYSGTLANGGERLALAAPEEVLSTNLHGRVATNAIYYVVNEVTYGTGGRWGNWSDAGGSSLELMDPNSDNRLAANWADSDETAKSDWTYIDYTSAMGETQNSPVNDNVHVYMLGTGECLVDDVEVRDATGTNILGSGGTFDGGVMLTNLGAYNLGSAGNFNSYWMAQGAYDQCTLEDNGYNGTKCLHIRAITRGDPGPNRVRSPMFGTTASGTITLRARVRWLCGWPEVLLRLHGGSVEAGARLLVPRNLGTPGAANSRAVSNAGPALFEVVHTPVLPAAAQPVVVTARVSDPDGLASLQLLYRVDPASTFIPVPMIDSGTDGDEVGGDGLYSALIPGQASGAMVAFYLQAVDARGVTNLFPQDVFPRPPLTQPFPSDSYSRECLVRFGEVQMPGTFATYHLWLTTSTVNRWLNRDPRSNAGVDGTFVYNHCRVAYNVAARSAGSPFHRGLQTTGPIGGNRVDYDIEFAADEPMLGANGVKLDLPGNGSGGNGSDTSGLTEQVSLELFKAMGIQYLHRRYVHVFVNGSQRSSISGVTGNFVLEDTQQPNGDYLREWYPDDPDGELTKMDDWFEFANDAASFNNNDGDLQRREVLVGSSSVVNLARYRYMWQKRSLGPADSANNFTGFLALLNALSPTTNDNAAVNYTNFNAVANTDQWAKEFACQRAVGNFDSYGFARGKNNYTYKPTRGRIEFLPFDVDWALGNGSRAYNEPLYTSSDPRMVVAYTVPQFRRAYMRSLKALCDGPFSNGFLDPLIDARLATYTANNVGYSAANVTVNKTYIGQRRDYILGQLAGLTNFFTITSSNLTVTSSNLVTLSGTASVEVETIRVNGVAYPLTWAANYISWTLQLPVNAGTNQLVLQAYDWAGRPMPGTLLTTTVAYTGPAVPPQGGVVLNEIMYHPAYPEAAYVELFNTSSNFTFDLSQWRINGLDYTFPDASFLAPRSFLVLAKDRTAFAAAYGTTIPVFAEYSGNLQTNGETLTLFKPGPPGEESVPAEVVAKVRYEAEAPWPTFANGQGPSLQLVDPARDSSRVINWSDGSGWRFYSYTGVSGHRRFMLFPDTAGDMYIDDIMFVAGSLPGVGSNYLRNGDFEGPLTTNQGGPWAYVSTNGITSAIDPNIKHAGNGSLHLIFTAPGGSAAYIYQDTLPTASGTYTLSFWYLPTTNINKLTLRTGSSAFRPEVSVRPAPASPGAANIVAMALPPLPSLWLNEVQPENLTGPMDEHGHRQPWIELYNADTNGVDLTGWSLSDNYQDLAKWAFPTGTVLGAGQRLIIWADGETNQVAGTNLHASFRLPSGSGSVALAMPVNNLLQVFDYLNYRNLPPDWSYGDYPDGQAFTRQSFYYVTPGATNNPASALLVAYINEWMADNVATVVDPADNRYEDWFELYNPGSNTVYLGGFFLTDTLTNKFQFKIPAGYTIPPRGFLRVWADNAPAQNNLAAQPDLHVNFQLNRDGEAMGLFAPDGRAIDTVSFGPQAADVSQGRFPDGVGPVYDMPLPTPAASNTLQALPRNTAPALGQLLNQNVVAGQAVRFTVTATDTDDPPQVLTFSLDAGAPAGAVIDPMTGVFTWTPAAGQAPSTNLMTVRVRDSGAPVMEAEGSFLVWVGLPPQFVGRRPEVNGSQVNLTFNTQPGKTYQVEYKDRLRGAAWNALGPAQTATGPTLTVTDTLTQNKQRYYRITVGD